MRLLTSRWSNPMKHLIPYLHDDRKSADDLRQVRWPAGVTCPRCGRDAVEPRERCDNGLQPGGARWRTVWTSPAAGGTAPASTLPATAGVRRPRRDWRRLDQRLRAVASVTCLGERDRWRGRSSRRVFSHASCSAGPVAVVDGQGQCLPVPRSSDRPAFRRDHWAMGRPSIRY